LVMIGIFSMFIILFRNIKLSLIGVVPNFIAAFFILGIIGLLGIPLDMMTITIAAITIGIAVDNSIHYIYRFKEEFSKIKDYNETLKKCHSTVGVAILNTSITIVFGFSILVLSKTHETLGASFQLALTKGVFFSEFKPISQLDLFNLEHNGLGGQPQTTGHDLES